MRKPAVAGLTEEGAGGDVALAKALRSRFRVKVPSKGGPLRRLCYHPAIWRTHLFGLRVEKYKIVQPCPSAAALRAIDAAIVT